MRVLIKKVHNRHTLLLLQKNKKTMWKIFVKKFKLEVGRKNVIQKFKNKIQIHPIITNKKRKKWILLIKL